MTALVRVSLWESTSFEPLSSRSRQRFLPVLYGGGKVSMCLASVLSAICPDAMPENFPRVHRLIGSALFFIFGDEMVPFNTSSSK